MQHFPVVLLIAVQLLTSQLTFEPVPDEIVKTYFSGFMKLEVCCEMWFKLCKALVDEAVEVCPFRLKLLMVHS